MKKLPLVLAAALLLPRLAHATTMVPPSDDEMVSGAQVIALAAVERLEVVISRSGQVMTHAELKIERGVRGVDDGTFISMEYPGGTLANGMKSTVPGAPQLKVGDRVFTYLRPGHSGALLPIGLRFGVLDVHKDLQGQLRASRRLDGLSFIDKLGKPEPTEKYHLQNVRLDALVDDIQARMRRLDIHAGGPALNTSRGQSIPVVRP
jgi:hypothetical protein